MSQYDKSVIITGASRGLGFALAGELGARGARVVLVARDGEALAAAVERLRRQGVAAHGIAADIGDKRAIHAITGAAAALVGPIDVLVNNASSLGPTPLRSLIDTECEDFERVLASNLVGPFRLTKVIAGSMAMRGVGVIVNISSDAAVEAYPTWGSYGVSKAALDHLTRIWAAELGASGVRFLSVDPGEMDTRMHADAIPDADPSTLADPRAVARKIADMIVGERAPNGARLAASGWEVSS
jgi:NAD(P)-dependent dehydrogenase (short-subunit alcohol dehydrogenase family)